MAYPSYSPAARDTIAATLDLSPLTVTGWLYAEGSGPGRNNPLNARGPVLPGNVGFTPAPGSFGIFPDLASAAKAYLYRLRNVKGVGYEAILAAPDALAQAYAIEASSWAAGHYGGGPGRDGNIVRYVKAHLPAAPPNDDGVASFPGGPLYRWPTREGYKPGVRLVVGFAHAPAMLVHAVAENLEGQRFANPWYRITSGHYAGYYTPRGTLR